MDLKLNPKGLLMGILKIENYDYQGKSKYLRSEAIGVFQVSANKSSGAIWSNSVQTLVQFTAKEDAEVLGEMLRGQALADAFVAAVETWFEEGSSGVLLLNDRRYFSSLSLTSNQSLGDLSANRD